MEVPSLCHVSGIEEEKCETPNFAS
jgi:hypothetical protein